MHSSVYVITLTSDLTRNPKLASGNDSRIGKELDQSTDWRGVGSVNGLVWVLNGALRGFQCVCLFYSWGSKSHDQSDCPRLFRGRHRLGILRCRRRGSLTLRLAVESRCPYLRRGSRVQPALAAEPVLAHETPHDEARARKGARVDLVAHKLRAITSAHSVQSSRISSTARAGSADESTAPSRLDRDGIARESPPSDPRNRAQNPERASQRLRPETLFRIKWIYAPRSCARELAVGAGGVLARALFACLCTSKVGCFSSRRETRAAPGTTFPART